MSYWSDVVPRSVTQDWSLKASCFKVLSSDTAKSILSADYEVGDCVLKKNSLAWVTILKIRR